MLPRYETNDEITMRLGQSVIMYGLEPFYVHSASLNSLTLLPVPIRGGGEGAHGVEPRDRLLNAHQYTIGYMNLDPCQFLYRIPVRKFKQGLTAQNMSVPRNRLGPIQFNTVITMKPFRDMLMNNYPPFQRSLDQVVEDDKDCIAFSKHCAVKNVRVNGEQHHLELFWRGRKVGESPVVMKPRFKFVGNNKYLREVFEQNGVNAD